MLGANRGALAATGVPFVDKLAAGVVGDPLTAHPKVDEPSTADAADAKKGKRLVTYGYRAIASPSAVAAGRGAFDSELMLVSHFCIRTCGPLPFALRDTRKRLKVLRARTCESRRCPVRV